MFRAMKSNTFMISVHSKNLKTLANLVMRKYRLTKKEFHCTEINEVFLSVVFPDYEENEGC